MKIIIDRFEGEFAVVELENGQTADIPSVLVPPEAAEGSVLEIRCLKGETEERRRAVREKMNSIFKK